MEINKNLMSRNHTAKVRKNKDIEFIVIHYVGALGDAKANTDYYKSNNIDASADFWVGHSGDIWQGNDYRNYYSWHCGGGRQSDEGGKFFGICTNANSIGIEMCVKKNSTATMNATDTDWYFTPETEKSCAELVKYLMGELEIDINHVIRHYDVTGKYCPNPYLDKYHKGAWDKFKAMIGAKPVEWFRVRLTWKDEKSQFGAYEVKENAIQDCPSGYSVYDNDGNLIYTNNDEPKEFVVATDLNGLSEKEKIQKMAPLYQKVMEETGMLASVGLAQFCLESGYGTTDLAQKANNLHGMKCSLSGNTWDGSTWDGKSKYTKQTAEQDANGNEYYITADFRKYPNMLDSIRDRAMYFIGAKNGTKLRYPKINTIHNAEEQIKLIKAGMYATDVNYVSKLMSIVKRFNLEQYDCVKAKQDEVVEVVDESTSKKKKIYRVQLGFYKSASKASLTAVQMRSSGIDCIVTPKGNGYMIQAGAYEVKNNAKSRVKELKAKSYIKKNKISPFYFTEEVKEE